VTTSSRLFAFIPATRIVAAGMSVSQQHVKVYVTKDHALHLANLAERDLSLSACELFGFGLGSWSLLVQGPDQAVLKVLGHVSLFQSRHFLLLCGIGTCSFSGVARQSVRQCFPWLLASDADAVVSVDGGEKKILAVSEMLCDAASKHGIMDFACHDYDMMQKTQVRLKK